MKKKQLFVTVSFFFTLTKVQRTTHMKNSYYVNVTVPT